MKKTCGNCDWFCPGDDEPSNCWLKVQIEDGKVGALHVVKGSDKACGHYNPRRCPICNGPCTCAQKRNEELDNARQTAIETQRSVERHWKDHPEDFV